MGIELIIQDKRSVWSVKECCLAQMNGIAKGIGAGPSDLLVVNGKKRPSSRCFWSLYRCFCPENRYRKESLILKSHTHLLCNDTPTPRPDTKPFSDNSTKALHPTSMLSVHLPSRTWFALLLGFFTASVLMLFHDHGEVIHTAFGCAQPVSTNAYNSTHMFVG